MNISNLSGYAQQIGMHAFPLATSVHNKGKYLFTLGCRASAFHYHSKSFSGREWCKIGSFTLSEFLEDLSSKTALVYVNMLSYVAFVSAFLNMINSKPLWITFTN